MTSSRPKPVLLCILDGWGCSSNPADNAISQAQTPCWDRLLTTYPHAKLNTSGLDVGLPEGQMGNSEVGHMNIGAGRVVMQELPRISLAASDGSLATNSMVRQFIAELKASGGSCHLLGLLSDGGVHAHQDHIIALTKIVATEGVRVHIHAFLDGRDTPPASALGTIATCEAALSDTPLATIATVSGRYYAMDRDNRWERVQLAYNAMVEAIGAKASTATMAVEASYAAGKTDEFVLPVALEGYHGMQDGDGVLMANFRSDRAREILTTLVDPNFSGWQRARTVTFAAKLGMVEYSEELNRYVQTVFTAEKLENILPEVISHAGLTQLRIAETEKYAHVTFFFSGGKEKEFPGEQRILVPSPKVATYDLQPEMSAPEVTDKLLAAIDSGRFDLIVVNFANGDMVGHTGDIAAAIKAVETLDSCLARLEPAIGEAGGVMLITADHGNAEQMVNPDTHEPHTAHTTNPVPLVLIGNNVASVKLANGRLADIAPTILDIMGLPKPGEMTGISLLAKLSEKSS